MTACSEWPANRPAGRYKLIGDHDVTGRGTGGSREGTGSFDGETASTATPIYPCAFTAGGQGRAGAGSSPGAGSCSGGKVEAGPATGNPRPGTHGCRLGEAATDSGLTAISMHLAWTALSHICVWPVLCRPSPAPAW